MVVSEAKLHTSIIKSEDNVSFNYLVHGNDDSNLTVYLYAMQGAMASYKTEVPLESLHSIAQQCEKTTAWVRDMLFCRETDVLWCIETEQSSAKVTWKKKLSNGMKLALGTVTMVEHSSAPSDMLSICATTLQQEQSRANTLQAQCQGLKTENSQLREIAEQAVQARELLEEDLIAKFACLLNKKKSKIRALHELLEERCAEEMDRAPNGVGSGWAGSGGAGALRSDSEPGGDADDPGSDAGSAGAYDQDTDVDGEGDGGATPPAAAPPLEDSLELDCGGLDDPLPVRPKRPAPEPTPPPPDKRRPTLSDSDDLLDIV